MWSETVVGLWSGGFDPSCVLGRAKGMVESDFDSAELESATAGGKGGTRPRVNARAESRRGAWQRGRAASRAPRRFPSSRPEPSLRHRTTSGRRDGRNGHIKRRGLVRRHRQKAPAVSPGRRPLDSRLEYPMDEGGKSSPCAARPPLSPGVKSDRPEQAEAWVDAL
jgi:hypothetical protein